MKLRYDFHLHSCLSPCGDDDMTPYNLVSMAKLLELDVIALTDHNSAGNCRSAVSVGESLGITVIPGMELCTAEEFHLVCLFPNCDRAEAFSAMVYDTMPPIKNKPEVFGEQRYMDSSDKILSVEPRLLTIASGIMVDDAVARCDEFGGVCYPAHIDRPSFSVLSSMGMIIPQWGFRCAEITPNADLRELTRQHPLLETMKIMRSSDAHYLENMVIDHEVIDAPECSAQGIIRVIAGK